MAHKEPLFQIGHTCATPGAAELLSPAEIAGLFSRHEHGEWGDVSPEDARENDHNARSGGRVRSVYQLNGNDFWIITEPDRFDSVLLLPSEYIAWESGEKRVYRERLRASLSGSRHKESEIVAGVGVPETRPEDFFVWLEEGFTVEYWTLYREQRFARRFAKGPLVPGLDRMTDDGLAENIDEMRRQLVKTVRDGTFRFRFMRRIEMEEGGKRRTVAMPVMRDRLLDNILARYLSSRLGLKPTPHVIVTSRQVQKLVSEGTYGWFVRSDIESYFDSVPHEPLLAWLRERGIPDEVVQVVGTLVCTPRITAEEMTLYRIDHGRHEWEEAVRRELSPAVGLPQGLYTSNILAEAWLADWLVSHPLPRTMTLVRYVDDMLFLCSRESGPTQVRRRMREIERLLGIRFSPGKTVSGRVEDGFDFLGFFHRPKYARRSERSIRRFKMRWIEALENPMQFLESRMDPWYLHGLVDTTDDPVLRESVIFGLVVYYYNLSIIGWGRTWEPDNLSEYENLQQLLPQIASGQIELEAVEADSLRERFAELNKDLFGINLSGSALYNSFCTDFRQIDEINRWAGRLFASHAARRGLAKPRLEDHLKWYFFFRKHRTGYTRKVLREYIKLFSEKKTMIEKLTKNTPL